MHIDALTAAEQRVLGCLIEKRFTTPDQYPLSLNALRLACNQSTNRDPVVNYDETTVREAVQRLARYGLTRLASGHSSRAVKYRHLAEDALGVDQQQLALLAVLLLRGEQTPGELKARAERMASFESLELVDAALAALCERGYAQRIGRRPGQKEDRFRQLLGGFDAALDAADGTRPVAGERASLDPPPLAPMPSAAAVPDAGGLDREALAARLASLEQKFERLAAAVADLLGESDLGRQGETDEEGDAADEDTGERHLETGCPPGAQREQGLRGADQEVGEDRDRG
jgi:uncharacterized protein YceH (UPF0502 family)